MPDKSEINSIECLLVEARHCQLALSSIAEDYDAGSRKATNALKALKNDWLPTLRHILNGLASAAPHSQQAAETGAGLMCTAVRACEATIPRSERIAWYEAFRSSADCFRDPTLKGKLLAALSGKPIVGRVADWSPHESGSSGRLMFLTTSVSPRRATDGIVSRAAGLGRPD